MDEHPSPDQLEAITAPVGPVLVVAGPGAGKTFCLIERIRYLIDGGMAPGRICAVTFTNKASEEIAQRLRGSIGLATDDITRGTLHSLCFRFLREFGDEVDLRAGFGVADEAYQQIVLRRLGVYNDRKRRDLLVGFGKRRRGGATLEPDDERLFVKYQQYLRAGNLIDFDDIIALALRLLRERESVCDTLANRWDYVLVDEFQDLSRAQYDIVRLLTERSGNLFGVGDDEQSIFSWAGADPAILTEFQRDYRIDRPVVLNKNRRCSRAIFSVARRLIDTNPTLFDKEIEAIRDSEFEVEAYVYPSETVEANWIVRDVQRDREASGLSWGDYAVLYRRHDLGADLESRMVAAGLPCRLAPRRALSDDEIVADVAGALELMMRPGDSAALEKYARIKLDDPDLMQDIVVQGHNSEDFLDVLRNYARRHRKRPEAKKVWRLIYHVENLPALLESHGDLASLVADLTIQSGGKYRNRLETEHDRLSDPLNYPGTDHLAAELEQALAVGRTVWLELGTGLGIALRGLLVQAGVSTTMKYLGEGDVHSGDVVLSRDRAHSGSLAMLVFKALQVMLSRGFDPGPADFVTFDLETTDLFVDRCEIVEIGAARVRGGAVAATYRQLVKPARPIAPNATQEAHGYTDEDVATAPSFAEVWPDFRNFVGDDLVVVHNGHKFDLPVLRRMTEPWGGTESMRFFDTLPLARNLLSQSARLPDLAAHFGIDIGTAHHALDDSLTLVRVYGELNRLKLVRSRKTTATNVLDFLALGLALEDTRRDTEAETLFGIARINALGSYSDCLEFYEVHRAAIGAADLREVDWVIDRLGGRNLMQSLRSKKSLDDRYPRSAARLTELISAAEEANLRDSIQRFLELVALSTSEGVETDPHRINLLTLHSTKGLEFSRVYVAGVEDYQVPGYYAVVNRKEFEMEESRRLLYVGATRARDRLVFTRALSRWGRDTGGNMFLDEMGLSPETIDAAPSS